MRQANLMQLVDPAWIDVLRAEAAKPGRTKQDIADELGISRPSVSLLCSGKYTAKLTRVSRKIAPKVMALYAQQVWCPHLRAGISHGACTENHSAPMTMSDPDRLKQWAACRGCSQNPENQKPGDDDAV